MNQILGKLKFFSTTDLIPEYSSEFLSYINESEIIHPNIKHSLLIGFDNIATINQLKATNIFVVNECLISQFQDVFPDRVTELSFGVDTRYTNKFFDTVILSDFVRLFSSPIRENLFYEINRIAKRGLVICTDNHISDARQLDNWGWASCQELETQLISAGLHVVKRTTESYSVLVFENQN